MDEDEGDDGITLSGLDQESLIISVTENEELLVDLMQPGEHAWVVLNSHQARIIRDYLVEKIV